MSHLEETRKRVREDILSKDGVKSITHDDREGEIVIGVEGDKDPELPDEIDGYPVRVVQDEIEPLQANDVNARPACASIQIGRSSDGGWGSTGFVMEDDDGKGYISTNGHVAQTEGEVMEIPSGGEYVGTTVFEQTGGTTIDFAYIRPEDCRVYNWLYGLEDAPRGSIYEPGVGDEIILDAANSGISRDNVKYTSVDVSIGDNEYNVYDCIRTETDVSIGGDSGSPWVYEDDSGRYRPVGINFASSSRGVLLCKAKNIEQETGLTIARGEKIYDSHEPFDPLQAALDPITNVESLQNGLRIEGNCEYNIKVTNGISDRSVGNSSNPPNETGWTNSLNDRSDRIGNNWYFWGDIREIEYEGEEPSVNINREYVDVPTTEVTDSDIDFDETVHLNEDHGLSEGEDAAPLVDRYLESGVQVLISPGEYDWSSNPLYGGTYNNARLASDTKGELVTFNHGDGFEFKTYFDCSDGIFEVQDIEFTGTTVYSSPDNYFACWASEPDATIRLKNVRRPDGCRQGDDGTGFYVRGPHEGTIKIIDCQAHYFTDNGLYASAPGDPSESVHEGGRIEVIRGFYSNNNIANVRLAGDYYAEGVVGLNDEHAPTNDPTNTQGHSQRNFWLRDGQGEIVNCDVTQAIDFGDMSGPEGVAVMMQHRSGSETSGTLKNCRIQNDETDYGAIHDTYSNSDWSSSGVNVTGSGDLSTSGHSVACRGSGCDETRKTPRPLGEGTESSIFEANPEPEKTVNLRDKGLTKDDVIDPYLSEFWNDNTEVIIPGGRYQYNGTGLGGDFGDSILRGNGEVVFNTDAENDINPRIQAMSGDVRVENITFKGQHDGAVSGRALQNHVLEFYQVRRPDGSEGNAFYAPRNHAGTFILNNCQAEGFTNVGIHGSDPQDQREDGNGGTVHVIDGYYANNRVANIRLSGDSTVTGSVSVQHSGVTQGDGSYRGIWHFDSVNATIEDVQVLMEKDYPPILVSTWGDSSTGHIENARIRNHGSQPAIQQGVDTWTSGNCHITGDGNLTDETNGSNNCVGNQCDRPDTSYTPEYNTETMPDPPTETPEGPAGDSNPQPERTVNLGDEGLDDGDTIDPYFDDYLDDDTEIVIPEGTYDYGNGLSGEYSDTIVRSENGGQVVMKTGGYNFSENIRANGGDVRFGNMTFRDTMQERGTMRFYTTDDDATIHAYRIWRPDGSVNRDEAGCEGFYIRANHAGHLIMEDCQAEGFSDNGLYASSFGDPAEPDDGGGSVEVLGGRYANCRVANVRVAGEARVEGVTTVQEEGVRRGGSSGGWHRALWLRDGGPHIVEDCDVYHTKTYTDPPVRIQARDGSNTEGVLRNCRIRNDGSSAAIRGSYDWEVRKTSVVGSGDLSFDPEEIDTCRGGGCSEPTSEFRSYTGEPTSPSEPPAPEPTDPRAELLDNSSPPYLLGFISAAGADASYYRFICRNEPIRITEDWYKSPSGGTVRATSNYEITQLENGSWLVEGNSGNGYGDAYEIPGPIDYVEVMTDSMWAELGQEEMSASEIVRITEGEEVEPPTEPESPFGGYLGGGDGYPNTIRRSEADIEVSTQEELFDAFDNASSGDIIYVVEDIRQTYVPGDSGEGEEIPRGVTLASNRGINGAEGARIYSVDEEMGGSWNDKMLKALSGVRITGLRIHGTLIEQKFRERRGEPYPVLSGVNVESGNVEIDNCEIGGFRDSGTVVRSDDVHIHHCDFIANGQMGLGYGVNVGSGGNPLIEYCTFDYNRHSIAASGSADYRVENCWFGPVHYSHAIDHHAAGGDDIRFKNITVEFTHDHGGNWKNAIEFRSGDNVPSHFEVENCWFYHPKSRAIDIEGYDWEDIADVNRNNHYGEDEPDESIGHPRGEALQPPPEPEPEPPVRKISQMLYNIRESINGIVR